MVPRHLFSALLFLGALILSHSAPVPAPAPLAKAYPWHLRLTDQDGEAFDLSGYRGRTLLLSFVYTHCPDACPLQTANLAKVQKLLPDSLKRRSAFLSVSIDPERDTPARLAAFAGAFQAEMKHWRFGVAGNREQLRRLMNALGIAAPNAPNASKAPEPVRKGAALDHSMAVLLIDASGRVIQRYLGDRMDVSRVAAEIGEVDSLYGDRGEGPGRRGGVIARDYTEKGEK